MMTGLETVDGLLNDIERKGGDTFIAPHVSASVRRSKYRYVWLPLIERYKELMAVNKRLLPSHIYCDMACTLITKKVMIVDLNYLYESSSNEEEDITRLREVHIVMARRYLAKMLTCVYECVHGSPPNSVDVTNAVVLLYAELYAEAFDPINVREETVFEIVQKWLGAHVEKPVLAQSYRNVAPGYPFLHSSHVYWLWLHLTAAKIRYSAEDLTTVIYALDTIVHCNTCRIHFLELVPDFFVSVQDHGIIEVFSRHPNDLLLFHMHNRVNALTGCADMDISVLSEYVQFWKSAEE